MSILQYRYTDTELTQILDSMIIITDSREKKNDHILNYLQKKGIKTKVRKLDYGDYSFLVPANPELGIMRDLSFATTISIERKASLEELSRNLAQDRARFEAELIRAKGKDCKFFLMIEDSNYSDIVNHKYKTDYKPKSYVASIITLSLRYNFNINFITKQCAGNYIYHTFYYYLRNYLKH
ncbi:MAG: hypothetical protein COA82_12610 [Alkaliphilus sp.]|nr:ERCC4 domain-containing protein [bacterium AH-315-E09]PHS29515.1 MAG: hypothetical protein COA82_12610 [Alkaliphilus sp.]